MTLDDRNVPQIVRDYHALDICEEQMEGMSEEERRAFLMLRAFAQQRVLDRMSPEEFGVLLKTVETCSPDARQALIRRYKRRLV